MPNVTGLSHIDLTVSDAERSAAWYRESLGLEQIYETDSPGTFAGRLINMVEPSTGLIISMVQHERSEPGAFSEFRVGLDHLALAVESRDDLEAWVEHFDRVGVQHSGITDTWYGSVLVFRDPDGIQLELSALTAAPPDPPGKCRNHRRTAPAAPPVVISHTILPDTESRPMERDYGGAGEVPRWCCRPRAGSDVRLLLSGARLGVPRRP